MHLGVAVGEPHGEVEVTASKATPASLLPPPPLPLPLSFPLSLSLSISQGCAFQGVVCTSELSLGSFTGRCTWSRESSATHSWRLSFLGAAASGAPRASSQRYSSAQPGKRLPNNPVANRGRREQLYTLAKNLLPPPSSALQAIQPAQAASLNHRLQADLPRTQKVGGLSLNKFAP